MRLIDRLGADFCIRHAMVPWKQIGGATIFVCAQPEAFAHCLDTLPEGFRRAHIASAPEGEIQAALLCARRKSLVRIAETRVAEHESCRTWNSRLGRRLGLCLLLLVGGLFYMLPTAGFTFLAGWAILTLILSALLKASAAIWHLRRPPPERQTPPHLRLCGKGQDLPVVSIIVPLFRERKIAARLVKRLGALTYPRTHLDICLAVEEDDTLTQETLAAAALPGWMRQITVPRGSVKTKPRALNFALDFCKGSIIGVYDAEDAPEPDQIHRVVDHFRSCGPKVVCLQGILDFYNARDNWLARCFTIEYATWFRVILPGLQRLGFVIPLGGTTLFFRRTALEDLGRWDAHNVTEDADLGVRLARRGLRTELLHSVTNEEANCRFWPWVKQRSRWIKGYAMTYGVHMRAPGQLLRDLGWWRFFGVQLVFLGTLSQFALAPILWSFWALPLGLPHPLVGIMPPGLVIGVTAVFVGSEVLSITVGVLAVSGQKHRHLRFWVPTLHLYFPLASLAAMKGFFEIVTRPFYWDKTDHGDFGVPAEDAFTPADPPRPHPP